ncbi:MAG: DNA repair protein RadA [Cycloclasticus sp.]|jgi:DNA repair protein RadA/Sms|nr:MAG: DNA repair protein RadA [Neptuniibacter sp. Phe_28]MBV1913547.1 DNA repair protein RadA [Cycloclasticus sp.]
MASKPKTTYNCRECGASATKWAGQCQDCGGWNTFDESTMSSSSKVNRYSGYADQASSAEVQLLSEVEAQCIERINSGLSELDRVLGGGIVPGSAILIGGDPGIGKSTLLLQSLSSLAQRTKTLYVTGEESAQQVSMRATRLQLPVDQVNILCEISLETILTTAEKMSADVLVVDSIQTVFSDELQSAPGSVGQVRECAARLVRFAKRTNTAIFLVGHVTKEGTIAGPRVLEHMVDSVLYFEGDSGSRFRVIRAIKNRFGAVNELGVFAMTEKGLREVANPSAIFLSRHEQEVPGSIVMVTREGTRPLLVEVQALVDDTRQGNPKRITVGMDQNRLAMLLAILNRHGQCSLIDQDVFVNIVGGLRVMETGGDLAVVAALLSSFKSKNIPKDWVVFGELGLSGEVRPVPNGEERLREAAKHGFKFALAPKGNIPKSGIKGLEIHPVSVLRDALSFF